MTQAQQDLFNLMMPPADLLPFILAAIGEKPAPTVWFRWLERMEQLHAMQKPHIIGSLSDEELAECFETVDLADLWAVTT